jgi:atypical dual specificity phosphatase
VQRQRERQPFVSQDDFSVPHSIAATRTLCADILSALRRGDVVCVHCGAGLGRTGLVAACVLLAANGSLTADDAIARVRETRRGTIETSGQEAFVAAFAAERDAA